MRVRYIVALAFCLQLSLVVRGQEFCIAPAHLVCDEELPTNVDTQIRSKMQRALASKGISADNSFARFALLPSIAISSYHTTAEIPAKVETDFDLVFSLVDRLSGKGFSTYSFPIHHKGANLKNAIAKGVAKVSLSKPDFQLFLDQAKEKIVEYYKTQSAVIIKQAKAAISSRYYEEALFLLGEIPEQVPSYDEALQLIEKAYSSYANDLAARLLKQAEAIWASSPTEEGASQVADLLAEMPLGTPSAKGAKVLVQKVGKKMESVDQRKWKLVEQQVKNEHQERVAMVQAAKAVGLAYARAESKKTTVQHVHVW